MKKAFKREGKWLTDETINMSSELTIFTGNRKRLSKYQRDKCLADLGSGSETEYQSARILYDYQDKSPRFLDWLIECCEKEETYLDSSLCWAFMFFMDKNYERILPALIKSFSKCPDENLGNYVELLGIWGGKEAKEVLKERYYKLKDNPQIFAKTKNWNDLAFSFFDICGTLLKFEPNNVEIVEYLVKFLKHPNSFNKEIAVSRIGGLLRNQSIHPFYKTRLIFEKAVEPLSHTNKSRIFGPLLPYLFQVRPEKTYEKFKKMYLKAKEPDRHNHLAFYLIHSVENSTYWISKLVRELPYEDSAYFREYLSWNHIKPMSNRELISAIKEDFASVSPNTRASSIGKLKYINNEDAQKILEEALIDEPDEFIRKQFEKHLKKLKKEFEREFGQSKIANPKSN